jgi:hypothetical protein
MLQQLDPLHVHAKGVLVRRCGSGNKAYLLLQKISAAVLS